MDTEPSKDVESKSSTLVSRNITVLGRRTSVRLEPEMWMALRDIARREKCKIHDLCSLIHLRKNKDTSLTAAIRVFLMLYYRAASTEDGHVRAGHGSFDRMMKRARAGWTALGVNAAGGKLLTPETIRLRS
ncbi:MAG: ribbon-helix-helix domain-containing protein [Alphaproteobacteria bacterium]|nr:ribbon-helix-helix domain-containing protein [Alphaproteobacteria bacterium]